MLRAAATKRIQKIRAKQLHSLCNWTDDFETLGEDLGIFVMHATASTEERTVDISGVRSHQKFGEICKFGLVESGNRAQCGVQSADGRRARCRCCDRIGTAAG
jgi:hypothetical protein